MCYWKNIDPCEDRVVDRKEPIIAYKRMTLIQSSMLRSPQQPVVWRGLRLTAHRLSKTNHATGIFAWKDFPITHAIYVIATVELSGRVLSYEPTIGRPPVPFGFGRMLPGYRAEKAKIISVDISPSLLDRDPTRVTKLCQRYPSLPVTIHGAAQTLEQFLAALPEPTPTPARHRHRVRAGS